MTRIKPGEWNENVCTNHALKVEDGIEVEKIINNFQDYFLTTMNQLCPIDSTKFKRHPSTFFNYETADILHPCSLDPKNILMKITVLILYVVTLNCTNL